MTRQPRDLYAGLPSEVVQLVLDRRGRVSLAIADGPNGRAARREVIEVPGVRERLKAAGWGRVAIRRWLREGIAPEVSA